MIRVYLNVFLVQLIQFSNTIKYTPVSMHLLQHSPLCWQWGCLHSGKAACAIREFIEAFGGKLFNFMLFNLGFYALFTPPPSPALPSVMFAMEFVGQLKVACACARV